MHEVIQNIIQNLHKTIEKLTNNLNNKKTFTHVQTGQKCMKNQFNTRWYFVNKSHKQAKQKSYINLFSLLHYFMNKKFKLLLKLEANDISRSNNYGVSGECQVAYVTQCLKVFVQDHSGKLSRTLCSFVREPKNQFINRQSDISQGNLVSGR